MAKAPPKIVEGAFHDTEAQPFTAQDFRFTTKNDVLYACELAWPSGGEAVIHSFTAAQLAGHKTASVSLLGSTSPISFDVQNDGMHLRLPPQPLGKYAHCFRFALSRQTPQG